MHPELEATMQAQQGVFTTAQALAVGYSHREIRTLKRLEIVSLRRGVHTLREQHDATDALGRHRLRLRALMVTLDRPAVASHVSAAAMQGLLLHEPDLSLLHVTRDPRAGARREAGVEHHIAELSAADVTAVSGLAVTTVARTVIDYARQVDFARGVVTADAALRAGASTESLLAMLERSRSWSGSRTAGRVITFADGGSESVGESLARILFANAGLPRPELQFVVADSGSVVARADFCFSAQRTLVEFDGRVKYLVPLGATPDAATRVLVREKKREDMLRALGFEVVRMVWSDLARPAAVLESIHAAFRRNAHRG